MSVRVKRFDRSARTRDSGRYWSSLFSVPISPIGMTSIMVMSNPSSPHQASMSPRSVSLPPFRATALIFTSRPADCAARSPARTLSRSPHLVICRNLSGSSVSSEMFTRRTPASTRSSAILTSWLPFVVIVSSSSSPALTSAPRARISCMMLRLTSGSPPVRRILRTPAAMNRRHIDSSSSRVKSSALGRKVISSAMQ